LPVDFCTFLSDTVSLTGGTMKITITLNQQVINQFCKENNLKKEDVKSDLLYFFHLIQDDKDFLKKEVLDKVFLS